jgi:hypothetical protein
VNSPSWAGLRAFVNFDNVGGPPNIFVKGSANLVVAAASAGQDAGVVVSPGPSYLPPSDHVSFLAFGIPALWFTTYPYPVLHQPNDTIDGIDAPTLAAVARVGRDFVLALGDEADADADLLPNGAELVHGTDRDVPDTDGDGMGDGQEVGSECTDPLVPDGASDLDADGLTNLAEASLGTNSCDADTDHDGLSDHSEVIEFATDPIDADTDDDELMDSEEVLVVGSDPLMSDSDGDGLPDGFEHISPCLSPLLVEDQDVDGDTVVSVAERLLGTNPCTSDSDGDGMPDPAEVTYACLSPSAPDANADSDRDGLQNIGELVIGTNPCLNDTDGDGLTDGIESGHACLLPLASDGDADPDADGYTNHVEVGWGTDPCVLDVNSDADPVPNALDNCDFTANPGQENIDAAIGNGPSVSGEDRTVPNGVPWEVEGDACETDGDSDNDGLLDVSDPDPGGDITYDDNNNGIPAVACLGGADPADDGPSWDTDCDGGRDGHVMLPDLGLDTDGDGLPDHVEVNKWGTCPDLTAIVGLLDCSTVTDSQDTDGDGMGDCQEVYDTDGNGAALFPSDGLNAVKVALLPAGLGAGFFGKDGAFDFNGDDALLFPTDGLNGVKAALLPAFCTP